MIKIEKLTVNRLDETLQLYRTVFGARDHTNRQAILERLHNHTGIFYIAVDESTHQVVGFKFGYVDGDTCIGRGIAVLPAYRRQGIATALLRRFEADLRNLPSIHAYVFGSATTEGIPFHLASGYRPNALLQFTDQTLRPQLDLAGFQLSSEGYNADFQIYQIYLELPAPEQNLARLRQLQEQFPATDVQFVFAKTW